MKLNFNWKNDGKYHQYCLICHAEKVKKITKNHKTFYRCQICKKISERSIVIDPAIKWWLDKDGEYWHESVGIFVRNKNNKFLFFERTIFPFALTVPSGHVDANENPMQSAIRELEEEVGIRAKNLVSISTENIIGDSCRRGADAHIWHAFLYEVNSTSNIKVQDEGINLIWLDADEALLKNLTYPVRFMLSKYKNDLSRNR